MELWMRCAACGGRSRTKWISGMGEPLCFWCWVWALRILAPETAAMLEGRE
jgi:hypothetical protein